MSDRWPLAARLAPVGLLALLALVTLAPTGGPLRLASGDSAAATAWTEALDALPEDPTVLVGFDPDVGTYAEVRATARAAIADLLHRDARVVLVSLTVEGRALLVAELARLARLEANPTRLLDLGYLPGAEAALVSLTRGPAVPVDAEGELARRLASEGMSSVDALLVVGGNDLGPRSWVEQVRPRVPALPLLALAPTVLLPELQPYLESGQLTALLGTPRDGAAYRASVDLGPLERMRELSEPPVAAVFVGIVAAIVALGQAWARRLAARLRETGRDGADGS
jgi:hypothetical protein